MRVSSCIHARPTQRLGFGPPRHRRGSGVAPATQMQHAVVARASGRHGRDAASSPDSTPSTTPGRSSTTTPTPSSSSVGSEGQQQHHPPPASLHHQKHHGSEFTMVSALRKRSDPPNPPTASSHPQAQRGRGKGRGRGARGGKAKRSRVRSPSPPPAVTSPEDERVDDEPVSHSLVSEGVVDEGLSSEAPTPDEEAPTADEEAPTVDEEASTIDYWCSKEYRAVNKEFSRRREAMQDPPHHQGNLNVKEYGERWASYHKAPLPNLFLSYALAHKGPYRTAMPYDENDPPSAYTSKTSYDRMEKFKGKAKELKGPDYDVTTEPLDHALVMISGDGRKHGKEAIAGGMFPRSSCRSLPEYKARLGLSKSSICQRLTPAMVEMEARLAEERRLVDERLEARLAEERQLAEARLVEERRLADARLAEERRLADEKEKRALLAQSSQCFAMFAAYCAQNGMPAMQMPHQSGHGSNTDGSSHAPGPSGNNLGGSPNL